MANDTLAAIEKKRGYSLGYNAGRNYAEKQRSKLAIDWCCARDVLWNLLTEKLGTEDWQTIQAKMNLLLSEARRKREK